MLYQPPKEFRTYPPKVRVRSLRAAKQSRYRRHDRDGLKQVRFFADPATLSELLREAEVFVPNAHPSTLGQCLKVFLDLWDRGVLRVTRCRGKS